MTILRQSDLARVNAYISRSGTTLFSNDWPKPPRVILNSTCHSIDSVLRLNNQNIFFNGLTEEAFHGYCHPIVHAMSEAALSQSVAVYLGDNRSHSDLPILAKTRPIINSSGITLAPLKYDHHWKNALNVLQNDLTSYEGKQDALVWRGATTGSWNGNINQKSDRVMQRYKLLKYLQKSPSDARLDVGFTQLIQNCTLKLDSSEIETLSSSVREPLSIPDQLQSKLVLVLEGNDVATSLKWVLASNSVPVMLAPSVESWLLESQLQPWVHYVPVSPDLDNLSEVVDHCLANNSLCKEISRRGKDYVTHFSDLQMERLIFQQVLREFVEMCDLRERFVNHEKSLFLKQRQGI
jgi:hypothetical protein